MIKIVTVFVDIATLCVYAVAVSAVIEIAKYFYNKY